MVLKLTQKEFDSISTITGLTNYEGTDINLDNELYLELYDIIETECENKPELISILNKMLKIDKQELITKTTI